MLLYPSDPLVCVMVLLSGKCLRAGAHRRQVLIQFLGPAPAIHLRGQDTCTVVLGVALSARLR